MGFFGRLFGRGKKEQDNGGLGPCVACDATDLTELAPAAYRCNACGHEGGDGYAAWKAGKKNAALAKLPADELRKRAARKVNDLRLLLVASCGEVARPSGGLDDIHVAFESQGFSLSLDFDAPRESRGALAEADAEERERIRREREMQLFQAGKLADELRALLSLWAAAPDTSPLAPGAVSIANSLNVDERTPPARCVTFQQACYDLMIHLR